MTDDQSSDTSGGRALLTDREREAIAGEATDDDRHDTRTSVRRRLERLEHDVGVLAEHDPELLEELQTVVCDTTGVDTDELPGARDIPARSAAAAREHLSEDDDE